MGGLEPDTDSALVNVEDQATLGLAQPTARPFTVQGARVALCMLRGAKPVETRRQSWWKPGWYNLHVGAGACSAEGAKLADVSLAAVPEEASPHKSSVVGQVLLGRVVASSIVDQPWTRAAGGEWSYAILGSREFVAPFAGGQRRPRRVVRQGPPGVCRCGRR